MNGLKSTMTMQYTFFLAPAFGEGWLKSFMEEDFSEEIWKNEHSIFPDSKGVLRSRFFCGFFFSWEVDGVSKDYLKKNKTGREMNQMDK